MNTRWNILKPNPELLQQIKKICSCHPITAAILATRLRSAEAADRFLSPSFNHIRSPFTIKDMDIAVERIVTAILQQEKILIFGDYDVDGVTSVTILYEFLQYVGATVDYYIPHRLDEGYGMRQDHIINHAKPQNVQLIITVDCGISSHDAIQVANKEGIDVIVTDHHEVGSLPNAVAIVNPKRPDCPSGYDMLAGVGVVYCLLMCLRKALRDIDFWKDTPEPNLKNYCDLVALGTIADIVPQVKENRIFSKIGLEVINSKPRPGIIALAHISGVHGKELDTGDIIYKLIPRLNAAGRLKHASIAVELLSCDDPKKAKKLAENLNDMNLSRRELEHYILHEIDGIIAKNPHLLNQKSLILSKPHWHEGVIGIVASRLVDQYCRPAILISIDKGVGRGSARAIPGVNLHELLSSCAHHLDSYGGHARAAGLMIQSNNIDSFKREFESHLKAQMLPDLMIPTVTIDYQINFQDISEQLLDELSWLAPFGPKNVEPLFSANNVKVRYESIVGKRHRRMSLCQSNYKKTSRIFSAIHFNVDTQIPMPHDVDQMAFKLQWNHWNGKKNMQLLVEEYQ
ncbi:MAG: single-stranded-DNA-specific exonuclease RecJ [Candidatus Magnetomorum sp.]|nr:single-stranded-DNA-specific exonuclease RecJ [Candidatus Magnetomorum sp.]